MIPPPTLILTFAGLAPSLTSTILFFRRLRALISCHILRDARIGAVISQKNDSFPFGDARVNPCNHHALGLFALGPEHLLAVNLVIGDCLLAFVRNEPVDELLAKLLLHMRMLGRVNQDDTVLVEQQFVALHREDEVGLVLERNPRAAVRHHVGSAGCCCVERGTHALPDRFVPRPSLLLDVDAGRLPEVEFGDMGAERSPREMKGAPLALMLCSAKAAFLDPLMLAGSSFGPMMTKSLYITEWRFTPNPCAMNFSSASLACTKTTSASPRRAVSSALPVPWATTLTTMPVFCLNSGRMWPNRPESCVEVVEATTMDLSCAEASDICARAKAITNERFRILGEPSLSGPVGIFRVGLSLYRFSSSH